MKIAQHTWLLFLASWIASPSMAQAQSTAADDAAPARVGIVFVVDGAGDFTTIADNAQAIFARRNAPFCVWSIRWSRSPRPADDHRDMEAHLTGGHHLAQQVTRFRTRYPNEKVYLIGHSTGTHVVLAGAGLLPSRSVERIVLTAPLVSCGYDLRPALRAARDGVDVWFSAEDGLAVQTAEHFGTADRQSGKAAAEAGFTVPDANSPAAPPYRSLRQYAWQPGFSSYGHYGGHFGFSNRTFLDAYVLPTMLKSRP